MKIFISYSVQDIDFVKSIDSKVKGLAEVFYWDKSKEPGKEVWPTIFSWIDQCDLVIALITDATVSRAMAVGHEVGRAIASKKLIIPLVSEEVKSEDIGCLQGLTYERFNKIDPGEAIMRIQRLILSRKAISDRTDAIVVCGLILFFLLASAKE